MEDWRKCQINRLVKYIYRQNQNQNTLFALKDVIT